VHEGEEQIILGGRATETADDGEYKLSFPWYSWRLDRRLRRCAKGRATSSAVIAVKGSLVLGD